MLHTVSSLPIPSSNLYRNFLKTSIEIVAPQDTCKINKHHMKCSNHLHLHLNTPFQCRSLLSFILPSAIFNPLLPKYITIDPKRKGEPEDRQRQSTKQCL
jgi:hypothetical protein